MFFFVFSVSLWLICFFPIHADAWEYRGEVLLEGVSHFRDRDKGRRHEQAIFDLDFRIKKEISETVSVTFRPQIYYEGTESRIRRFEPLEAYVDFKSDSWDLRIGQAIESWAITDTFNPADVLNRRDLERSLMIAPKLGEVMVRFRRFLPDGENIYNKMLNIYFLPWFRESEFPKKDDPYSFERGGAKVADDYGIRPQGFQQMGLAMRYGASWETLDFFLLAYHGMTRNPVFQAEAGATILRPVYYLVDKAGGGFQWAAGDWLFKLELVRTWTRGDRLGHRLLAATKIPGRFLQYVAGFDRSFYDLWLSNSTLTWTTEYSGEDRTSNAAGEYRPFKSDIFTQLKYDFGNISQMALTVALAYDVMIGESITDATFEWKPLREFENWKVILKGEFQMAAAGAKNSFLRAFPDNSYVSLKSQWNF